MDYKKILARVVEKWPAKVLSVVAAIFLFTFHRMGEVQERFFSVPLHLDGGSLVPAVIYPQNVRISIRGDSGMVYRIAETDIEARLDLSRYGEPGFYRIPVQIQRKGNAAEAEAMEITSDPAELTLELDTRISKYVPVIPAVEGYPQAGYEMVSSVVEPDQAVIDGPAKLMGGISAVETESIDLRSRNAGFSLQVRLVSPNPLVRIRGEGSVEFRGFVQELIVMKNYENLPVSVLNLPEAFTARLEPGTASVRIQGNQKAMDALNAKAVLGVDLSTVTEAGIYERPLLVEMGEGLSADRLEPEMIQVEVLRIEEKTER